MNASQAVFARYLNVSTKLVSPRLLLVNDVDRNPLGVQSLEIGLERR